VITIKQSRYGKIFAPFIVKELAFVNLRSKLGLYRLGQSFVLPQALINRFLTGKGQFAVEDAAF
jgi:hypothetical protein